VVPHNDVWFPTGKELALPLIHPSLGEESTWDGMVMIHCIENLSACAVADGVPFE
jgi:hypothetical protein